MVINARVVKTDINLIIMVFAKELKLVVLKMMVTHVYNVLKDIHLNKVMINGVI